MGFIHKWIIQIAAVILIGSVCDLLMSEGSIKKYLNPVLGFLLLFIIVKPLTTLDADRIRLDLLAESSNASGELISIADSTTQNNILDIYIERLSDRIGKEIRNTYAVGSRITLVVSDNDKSFGEISKIEVVLLVREGDFVNTATVSKMLENKFGIDYGCIDIKTEVIN